MAAASTPSGNFSVPIPLPAGRNGFQPQLTLGYSTGNGNGPFGLGWTRAAYFAVLDKPFDLDDLLATSRSVIGRAE